MKRLFLTTTLVAIATASHAVWFTNSVSVDSFVRASAPGSNYGGAGALTVSGSGAVNGSGVANGASDTFIRFNTGALVASFDSLFGTNNWVVNGARLRVAETAAPNNALFNRGAGAFEIRWIANDTWTEGTGTPSTPAARGIIHNDEAILLNAATDASLGTFTNAGVDGAISFSLALPAVFADDAAAGGEVGLFLTAIDPGIGFTFNARNSGTASARPYLEISAVAQPVITSISLANEDVIITATNGIVGETYHVLSATSVGQPLDGWSSIATNPLSASGEFTTRLKHAASTAPARFFILVVR